MLLMQSFSDFLQESVNLNPSRLKRIKSAHRSVRDRLQQNGWVRNRDGVTILQGSYALATPIKSPHETKHYDVDVVLGLKLGGILGLLPDGREVLERVQEALEAVPLYYSKTEILERCVRVGYSSDGLDFHLDVLPAHMPNQSWEPLLIPRDWRQSNPLGYINWFRRVNSSGGGYLPKVVRLLKFWRDLHRLDQPNSMVLTTLAGTHLPQRTLSVDDALTRVLRGIAYWSGEVPSRDVPVVSNPSLPSEDLARNWDPESFEWFCELIRDASRDAKAALDSQEEEEAVELWNGHRLFDGYFPTIIRGLTDQYSQTSQALVNDRVTIGTGGGIGMAGIAAISNKGFYGDV